MASLLAAAEAPELDFEAVWGRGGAEVCVFEGTYVGVGAAAGEPEVGPCAHALASALCFDGVLGPRSVAGVGAGAAWRCLQ